MQRAIPLVVIGVVLVAVLVIGSLKSSRSWPTATALLQKTYRIPRKPSVDHAKLSALNADFATPQAVTLACLSCHTERGREVMASSHWNWEREEYIPDRGVRSIGKKDILNNFCIGVTENLESCDKCHAGYGFTGLDFDFADSSNIDCLICHDNSGTYARTSMGQPDPSVDLAMVVKRVGRPTRDNCGYCHFYGGGGNNVKHGDLEEALINPERELDVHMDASGSNLVCVDCHTAEHHVMRGKLYSVSSMNRNRSSCEQCHGVLPHQDDILNEHTLKVACQTCHIPTYARANPTKMTWDWSTAGQLRDGRPFEVLDSVGNPTYMTIKGSFTWDKNVRPDYVWFNGTAGHYLIGDTVSDGVPIHVNRLNGSYEDPEAKIIPVKIHRSKQLYDSGTRLLLSPKLYASEAGQGAFWKDFDWDKAARAGAAALHLTYSGKYSFASTQMMWPVNHMVAPKEQSVTCAECHTRDTSRMAGLDGFYMPGRDRSEVIDGLGTLALAGALAAVFVHASARLATRGRRRTR